MGQKGITFVIQEINEKKQTAGSDRYNVFPLDRFRKQTQNYSTLHCYHSSVFTECKDYK